MNMRIASWAQLSTLLLIALISSNAPAQESPEKPPEISPRGSARGGDPAERLKRMLEFFDADKDGVLTKEEFKGDQSRFKRMDANGDGKISREEFLGPGPFSI